MPKVRRKPGFVEVFQSDSEEIAALQSFRNIKERQLKKYTHLCFGGVAKGVSKCNCGNRSIYQIP